MSNWQIFGVACLATAALACADDPVTSVGPVGATSAQGAEREQADYIRTPAGLYARSCVHEVPNGGRVGVDGSITSPNGTRIAGTPCAFPAISTVPRPEGRIGVFPLPTNNGWIEYAHVQLQSGYFSHLGAGWRVPAKPVGSVTGSQIYYSFPGLESDSYIIQPVIQYANNAWTAASWRCNYGTDCHHGTPISISAGDSIVGSVDGTACANGRCTWTIVLVDQSRNTRSNWTVTDTSQYFWAAGGAVEVYGLNTCSQYPQGGVFYSGIGLRNETGSTVTPSWTPEVQSNPSPNCSFSVSTTATTVSLYHNPAPVPVFSVWFSGPSADTAHHSVTVTAHPTNGTSPYTYAWTVNGSSACSNSASCSATLGDQGTFTTFAVTVTDAALKTAFGYRDVFAQWNDCPLCWRPVAPDGGGRMSAQARLQRSNVRRNPTRALNRTARTGVAR